MTLIVSIKTDDFIVMAADGMAYTRPQAGAATPYETQKLHVANVSWIIGFARWAGIEVQHQELESQIEMGVMDFDSDVRIGGPAYLEALRTLLKKSGGKSEPSVVRLAGFDRNGNPRVYEVVFPDGQLYPAANASACGVPAAATAQWIINLLFACCHSPDDYRDLALFTISQIAKIELTVGDMKKGYRLSSCVLRAGVPPEIKPCDISRTLARTEECEDMLCSAFTNFLSYR